LRAVQHRAHRGRVTADGKDNLAIGSPDLRLTCHHPGKALKLSLKHSLESGIDVRQGWFQLEVALLSWSCRQLNLELLG